MHIGNGTATIRSELMMGRPLSGPADPAWVKGMPSRLYFPLVTQISSQDPTVYASRACSLSALTVAVPAPPSASLVLLSSTKIMSYSIRQNLLLLTLHIHDHEGNRDKTVGIAVTTAVEPMHTYLEELSGAA